MIRTKQKDISTYILAIAQGALIGIVGFLIMGYIITYIDGKQPPEDDIIQVSAEQPEQNTNEKEQSDGQFDFYTIQYGVFSTQEAAESYLKGLGLATASIVRLDNYLFIWDGLSAEATKLSKKPEVQSFTKKLIIKTTGCPVHIELLVENLENSTDQNFILTHAEAAKLQSEEMQKLQNVVATFKDKSVSPLFTLDSVLTKEACVAIELD